MDSNFHISLITDFILLFKYVYNINIYKKKFVHCQLLNDQNFKIVRFRTVKTIYGESLRYIFLPCF